MKKLPNTILLKMDRPKLEAYITMVDRLLDLMTNCEDADQLDQLVVIMLERIRTRMKQAELKLQNHFRVTLPIEQGMAFHIALKECGGAFNHSWLMPYYNMLMLQIDPILS